MIDARTVQVTSARDDASAVLDRASLDRLAALDPSGSGGFVQRLLTTYFASLEKLRAQAQAALADNNRTALAAVAHTLKSASASVGALDLARLCDRLEEGGRADRPPATEAEISLFFAEMRRVQGALAALLARPAS